MQLKIINWAAQPIRVETTHGVREYPVSGRPLKLETLDETLAMINGETPIIRKVFFPPDDDELPEIEEGVYYIVPNQVMAIMRRPDFISPDTKPSHGARRGPDGFVESVRRFRVFDELRTAPRRHTFGEE